MEKAKATEKVTAKPWPLQRVSASLEKFKYVEKPVPSPSMPAAGQTEEKADTASGDDTLVVDLSAKQPEVEKEPEKQTQDAPPAPAVAAMNVVEHDNNTTGYGTGTHVC